MHCKLDKANSSFVSNSLRGELKFYLFIILHFQKFFTNLDLKQEYWTRHALERKLSVLNHTLIRLQDTILKLTALSYHNPSLSWIWMFN